MTELYIFLGLGVVLLGIFLYSLRRSVSVSSPRPADTSMLVEVMSLPGLSFNQPETLFDDRDYMFLCALPGMSEVASRFKMDRQKIVLHWLELLQQDVYSLWRLRRLLSREGITTGMTEELKIAGISAFALMSIFLVRTQVRWAGPFAPVALFRRSRRQMEIVSQVYAGLLSKIPTAKWEEFKRLCEMEFPKKAAVHPF